MLSLILNLDLSFFTACYSVFCFVLTSCNWWVFSIWKHPQNRPSILFGGKQWITASPTISRYPFPKYMILQYVSLYSCDHRTSCLNTPSYWRQRSLSSSNRLAASSLHAQSCFLQTPATSRDPHSKRKKEFRRHTGTSINTGGNHPDYIFIPACLTMVRSTSSNMRFMYSRISIIVKN